MINVAGVLGDHTRPIETQGFLSRCDQPDISACFRSAVISPTECLEEELLRILHNTGSAHEQVLNGHPECGWCLGKTASDQAVGLLAAKTSSHTGCLVTDSICICMYATGHLEVLLVPLGAAGKALVTYMFMEACMTSMRFAWKMRNSPA